MLHRFRDFLQSNAGKALSVGLIVVALGLVVRSIKSNFGPSDATTLSSNRLFIDSVTGKTFDHEVSLGEKMTITSPAGNPGYPAELCFWNADGSIRTKPFPVLINDYIDKPGPTFCPDCGRLVVPHNPMAAIGVQPPPTKAEYEARPNRATE